MAGKPATKNKATNNNKNYAMNEKANSKTSLPTSSNSLQSNSDKGLNLSSSSNGVTNEDIANMILSLQYSMDNFKLLINKTVNTLREDTNIKLNNITADLELKIGCTNANVSSIEFRNEQLAKLIVRKDVIVTGVPVIKNEDFKVVFSNICKVIGFNEYANAVESIFRKHASKIWPPINVINFDKNCCE